MTCYISKHCRQHFRPREGYAATIPWARGGEMALLCPACAARMRAGGRLPRAIAEAALTAGAEVVQTREGCQYHYYHSADSEPAVLYVKHGNSRPVGVRGLGAGRCSVRWDVP